MSKLQSLALSKQQLDEINHQLAQHGVGPAAGLEEKLGGVWLLYQRAEADLKAGSQSMAELQRKQAEEMKEVELYVENIRKLAEERETLTQEFETENEELKRENKKLKNEQEQTNKEIQQLLKQEGFDDLAKGTASEAVAYFLVERTRLSDKIDTERRKSLTGDTPKANTDQDLKAKVTKVEREKERLEQEGRQHIQRVKELELELRMLKTRLEKEKETHHKEVDRVQKRADEKIRSGSTDEVVAQLRESKRKMEAELTTMKYRLKTSEDDKEKVNQQVKELHENLEAERKRRSSYEGTIIKLKHLLDTNRKTISALEEEKGSLSDEKKSLEKKCDQLHQSIEDWKTKEAETPRKQQDLAPSRGEGWLEEEVQRLQRQNETCVGRLEETMISLESEKMRCRELERKLSTTEEKWELVVKRYRDNEKQLNGKLDKLSQELDGSKMQVSNTQLDILRLQAENKRIVSSSTSEKEKLRDQLEREQSLLNKELDRHRGSVRELEGLVDDLRKDRDVLAHELQAIIGKGQRSRDLGASGDQSPLHRELRDKKTVTFLSARLRPTSPGLQSLESSLDKHTSLQLELDAEKRKNKDLTSQLAMAERTSQDLQEQLGRKSVELFRQYDDSREGQNKMETELFSLRKEVDLQKALASKEKVEAARSLDQEVRKSQELEAQLNHKNEEITSLRREVGRLSLDESRSGEKVQEETRRRSDIESRNKVLEEEMSKLWGQMKSMIDRLSETEKAKHDVEAELTRLTNQYRHQEAAQDMHHAETVAVTTTLSRVQQRAQAAERKIPELQSELDQTALRLQAAEVQLKDYGALKVELQEKRDEVTRLKAHGQDDKLQRSVMSQQLEDLQMQTKAGREVEDRLRKENKDLKDQLLELQAQLHEAQDTSRSVNDKHSLAEQSRASLLQQLGSLQGENQSLRQEMSRLTAQLDGQLRKYQDHKANTKTKMQQAREIFSKQKAMLGDSLMKLQEELNATKAQLQQTCDSQSNVDNKHQSLLAEHRDLLTKVAELEEALRDQSRDLGSQDYRVRFLERENGLLQERIDTLSKQRLALEKLVREYRLEKQKEEINRSISGVPPMPSYSMYGQPGTGTGGYTPSKTPPSSGVGTSLSNLSMADLPNGHSEGLLVKASRLNGSDLALHSPSATLLSNGGSI